MPSFSLPNPDDPEALRRFMRQVLAWVDFDATEDDYRKAAEPFARAIMHDGDLLVACTHVVTLYRYVSTMVIEYGARGGILRVEEIARGFNLGTEQAAREACEQAIVAALAERDRR